MVVLGHWLAVLVTWEDGTVTGENALNVVPDLWPLTWVFQVMPLFFFVGGFSNRKSYESVRRRGGGYVMYIGRRLDRLLVPTLAFLAVGLTAATVLDAIGAIEDLLRPAARVVTLPLWFLGVYLIVIAVAPVLLALHNRFGAVVVIALAGGAVTVDIIRFGLDIDSIGYLNYAFVWLLIHQLGFLYADDLLGRFGAPLALAGAGLLVGLIALGPYPASLVGISSDDIDNMNPPTLPILALAATQIGVAVVLRRPVTRWLQHERPWRLVVAGNQRIMTVFLWHMAAVLPTIAIIHPLGFPQPEPGGAAWWALRPVWIALQLPVLFALVAIFGRFETLGRLGLGTARPEVEDPVGRVAVAVGAVLAGLGIIGFARLGLEPVYSDLTRDVTVIDVNSARSALHLLLALVLLRAPHHGWRATRRAATAVGLTLIAASGLGGLGAGLLASSAPETGLHLGCGLLLIGVALGSRSPSTRQSLDDRPRSVESRTNPGAQPTPGRG